MEKQKVAGEMGRREKRILFRMYIVLCICFAGFVTVLSRAIYLHLADDQELKWIADKQYNAKIPQSIRRGRLFDRNGAELAISLPVPSIYVDPSDVEDVATTARQLSKTLGVGEKELLKKFSEPRRFVWVKRRISHDAMKKVMTLNLPGVYSVEESKRFYPNGELASQVLGAVGYDSQALAGVEMAYGDILISKKKSSSYKRDAKGRLYATPVSFEEQSDVGEIYLTIDKQMQFIAETALRKAVKSANAADGVAVVIDPGNGNILAMASAPSFDPNRYSKYPIADWRNRPVTDAYEPGSTFKVFVVASAIEAGVVNTESVYNCENGAIRIGRDVLNDHHPYRDLSVQDIIKYSSNIGALKIAFDLGKERLFGALKKFGIGSEAGIGFPGEVRGVLRNYKSWQPVEHATVAFGQGLTVTPLQMAAAFSAVVNGGIYYRPHMVERIIDRHGEITYVKPEVVSQPVSQAVSDTMRYMLARVVEKGGTGTKAFSKAYEIGGKTGTAQKVVGGSGYAKGKYFASFIAFAPVSNPLLVVFVGIDEPKGAYYGGTVAAPAVKEIIERSLNYMGVPSAVSPVIYASEDQEKALEVGYQTPDGAFQKIEMQKAKFEKAGKEGGYIMPNLKGMTMRGIMLATEGVNIEAEMAGSGIAAKQDPAPGSVVGNGNKFSVRFELPK